MTAWDIGFYAYPRRDVFRQAHGPNGPVRRRSNETPDEESNDSSHFGSPDFRHCYPLRIKRAEFLDDRHIVEQFEHDEQVIEEQECEEFEAVERKLFVSQRKFVVEQFEQDGYQQQQAREQQLSDDAHDERSEAEHYSQHAACSRGRREQAGRCKRCSPGIEREQDSFEHAALAGHGVGEHEHQGVSQVRIEVLRHDQARQVDERSRRAEGRIQGSIELEQFRNSRRLFESSERWFFPGKEAT